MAFFNQLTRHVKKIRTTIANWLKRLWQKLTTRGHNPSDETKAPSPNTIQPHHTEAQNNLENLIIRARDPITQCVIKETDPNNKIQSIVAFRSLSVLRCSFKTAFEHEKITQLIKRIVQGKKEQAENMLTLFPNLLLNKTTEITDHSGRKFKEFTPFQVALCAGNVDMCKMIKKIFYTYPKDTGGEVQMAQQFAEVFPESEGGFAGHLDRQKQNVFDFKAIVTAISKATSDEVTEQALKKVGAQFIETEEGKRKSVDDSTLTLTEALNRFREQFAEKSHNEIIFNPEHLMQAFATYNDEISGWDCHKADLFWRQCIGFVQRFLPAVDADKFEAKPPPDWTSCSDLGFDYAACGSTSGVGTNVSWRYQNYINEKKTYFGGLMPTPSSSCKLTG